MASSDEETDTVIAAFTKQNTTVNSQEKTLFYVTSFITVLVPIYMFIFIFDVDLWTYLGLFSVVSVGSAVALSYSYQNIASSLKMKLESQREGLITLRSVEQEAKTKGEKPNSLVKKKKEHIAKLTTTESLAFSIFYNNSFFLLATVVLSNYIFGSTPAPINYVLSVSLSSALLSFTSSH